MTIELFLKLITIKKIHQRKQRWIVFDHFGSQACLVGETRPVIKIDTNNSRS